MNFYRSIYFLIDKFVCFIDEFIFVDKFIFSLTNFVLLMIFFVFDLFAFF